jgi:hypothetical protein
MTEKLLREREKRNSIAGANGTDIYYMNLAREFPSHHLKG